MINGDHAQPPAESHTEPQCSVCHDHGWIDDRSTATPFVKRCPADIHERELVSTQR